MFPCLAEDCKTRMSKPISLPWLCTPLQSIAPLVM
jgi:hypothetical protein